MTRRAELALVGEAAHVSAATRAAHMYWACWTRLKARTPSASCTATYHMVRPAGIVVVVGDSPVLVDWGSSCAAGTCAGTCAGNRGVPTYSDKRVWSERDFQAQPARDVAGALYTLLAATFDGGCVGPWLARDFYSDDDMFCERSKWVQRSAGKYSGVAALLNGAETLGAARTALLAVHQQQQLPQAAGTDACGGAVDGASDVGGARATTPTPIRWKKKNRVPAGARPTCLQTCQAYTRALVVRLRGYPSTAADLATAPSKALRAPAPRTAAPRYTCTRLSLAGECPRPWGRSRMHLVPCQCTWTGIHLMWDLGTRRTCGGRCPSALPAARPLAGPAEGPAAGLPAWHRSTKSTAHPGALLDRGHCLTEGTARLD